MEISVFCHIYFKETYGKDCAVQTFIFMGLEYQKTADTSIQNLPHSQGVERAIFLQQLIQQFQTKLFGFRITYDIYV